MNEDNLRLMNEMLNQIIEKAISMQDKIDLLEKEVEKQTVMNETLLGLKRVLSDREEFFKKQEGAYLEKIEELTAEIILLKARHGRGNDFAEIL